MFFRATVLSLLGCLIFLHLESQIRLAVPPVPLQTVEPRESPPPAPIVVVAPETGASTQVVDVRRSDIDRLLGVPGDLARSARIVPSIRHGAPSGFKLYAIRPGSALAAIGVENGDTIHRVNDLPLDTADGAMAIYTETKVADHFDVELTRRGQPHRIVVLVHDGG